MFILRITFIYFIFLFIFFSLANDAHTARSISIWYKSVLLHGLLQKKIMILVCLLVLGLVIVGYVSSYFVWGRRLEVICARRVTRERLWLAYLSVAITWHLSGRFKHKFTRKTQNDNCNFVTFLLSVWNVTNFKYPSVFYVKKTSNTKVSRIQ